MGKVKKPRQKYHSSVAEKTSNNVYDHTESNHCNAATDIVGNQISVSENLFSGLNISIDALNKNLDDDTKSVKSVKCIKDKLGIKQISKKDKLKLRRGVLLQKIDLLNQLKKENKIRKKRSKNVIIGNTNALRDALPSLDLISKPTDLKVKVPQQKQELKCIAKVAKRKKDLIDGVKIYKSILSNKHFKKDPLGSILQQAKQRVQMGDL